MRRRGSTLTIHRANRSDFKKRAARGRITLDAMCISNHPLFVRAREDLDAVPAPERDTFGSDPRLGAADPINPKAVLDPISDSASVEEVLVHG